MANGKTDELLAMAQKALKEARPRRRRIGVVEADGRIEEVLEPQRAAVVTPPKADVVPFKRK